MGSEEIRKDRKAPGRGHRSGRFGLPGKIEPWPIYGEKERRITTKEKDHDRIVGLDGEVCYGVIYEKDALEGGLLPVD